MSFEMERSLVILTVLVLSQGVVSTSIYESLVNHIKSRSNPMLNPRHSIYKPLVVDFQVGWLNIEEVDYRNNEVEGIFATAMTWDSGISWDPSDFNERKYVVLPTSDVYHPDIKVFNIVNKLETWLDDRVSINASGKATLRFHSRGRIFCKRELQDSNTCRIGVTSYSHPSDTISFLNPSKRTYHWNKIYDKYYFQGSRYNVTSQRYKIHKKRVNEVNMEFELMDYVFSVHEKEPHAEHRPFQAVFEFH